jgi:O-antigen ligase
VILGDSSFRKGLFRGAAFVHIFCPLIFLTHFTQNPYSLQIIILQSSLLLLWGGVGILLWHSRNFTVVRTPLDVPLIFFGAWALVSWGLSYLHHGPFFRPGIAHEGSRAFLFLWVNAIGAFFFSTQLAREPEGRVLRQIMLGVAGISATYGVLQYFGYDPIWTGTINPFAGRPVSTYGNPNFLSSVLVLFLPLILNRFLLARTFIKTLGWGSLLFIFVGALISTMTRSSWIGAGVGLLLYIVWDRKTVQAKGKKVLLCCGGICAFLVGWPAARWGSVGPLSRLLELWKGVTGEMVYAPWHQRLLIWRSAWDMWTEAPWRGKGWGLFELFFPYYQGRLVALDLFQPLRTHANNAHQLLLEIGSQTGLMGVGLFLWIVVVAITAHHKSRAPTFSDQQVLRVSLFAGMVGMATDNIFGNVSLFFAVPGFLFFWVFGQWAGFLGSRKVTSLPHLPRKLASICLIVICVFGINTLFRGFFAEAALFKGSTIGSDGNDRTKEEHLLRSKKWNRFDVHTAFELGNLYSRRMEKARNQGFQEETRANAEKAVEAYTDALRSNPGYNELFESRAMALRVLHRDAESDGDLRMALLINPLPRILRERKALYSTVQEEAQKGEWKEAHDHAEQLIGFFPDDPLPLLMSADTAAQLGEDAVAIKRYQEFLLKQPDHPEATENLIKVLDRQGRHAEAIALMRSKP